MNDAPYQAGVCNIGGREVKLRKILAFFGFFDYFFLGFIFLWLRVPEKAFLILFFPALMGLLCLYQSRQKFCVAYGLSGIASIDQKIPITDENAKAQDKQKSKTMIMQAVLGAAGLTAVAYFAVPFLMSLFFPV